jgi:tRNA-dihydrouridine synthase 1
MILRSNHALVRVLIVFTLYFSNLLVTSLMMQSIRAAAEGMRLKPMKSASYLLMSERSANFYRQLGSPKFISAPMVDQSSIAWRTMVRKYDVGLAYTPMINAKIFARSAKVRKGYIDWLTTDGSPYPEDSPLIAQLAGDNIHTLVESGKHIQDTVTAIDLNLGCPQNIARKGHYGAYLLQEPELVLSILSAMVKSLRCPITAKIRRLASDADTVNFCKEIEACGVQLITLHGRTVDQCKLFTGAADWDVIRQVKQAVCIPVIANGGISDRADAIRCMEYTGADGVMSSEALLENPKLFASSGLQQGDSIQRQFDSARELTQHFHLYNADYENFNQLRGHLFKILHRYLDAPKNVDLRNELAECDVQEIEQVVDKLELRYTSTSNSYRDDHEQELLEKGLLSDHCWYYRHRSDRAQQRIYSPKKVIPKAGRDENTPELVASKLEALRQRLKQRKLDSVQ